jgi:hypothetical protein
VSIDSVDVRTLTTALLFLPGTLTLSGRTHSSASSLAFMPLVSYILGANQPTDCRIILVYDCPMVGHDKISAPLPNACICRRKNRTGFVAEKETVKHAREAAGEFASLR